MSSVLCRTLNGAQSPYWAVKTAWAFGRQSSSRSLPRPRECEPRVRCFYETPPAAKQAFHVITNSWEPMVQSERLDCAANA